MTKRAPGVKAERVGKGHPRREARRLRAAERLEAHVNGPRCGPNCPKKTKQD
jgi:hypothetical protein